MKKLNCKVISKSNHVNPVNGLTVPDETYEGGILTAIDRENFYIQLGNSWIQGAPVVETFPREQYYLVNKDTNEVVSFDN